MINCIYIIAFLFCLINRLEASTLGEIVRNPIFDCCEKSDMSCEWDHTRLARMFDTSFYAKLDGYFPHSFAALIEFTHFILFQFSPSLQACSTFVIFSTLCEIAHDADTDSHTSLLRHLTKNTREAFGPPTKLQNKRKKLRWELCNNNKK